MVSLRGELDLATAPSVSAKLGEEVGGDGDLVVDAGEVSFVDVSGCRALLEVAERLPTGRRLVLAHAPPQLAKVLKLCGWLDHPRLAVYPDAVGGTA
jgi:anti-anti-sigma factor